LLPLLPLLLLPLWLQLTRAYSRKASRLPALIWQQRKRALGPPRSGRMSIVVTDIQGYSTLTNEAPNDMAQVWGG
jgi:ribosomal protein L18E